MKIVLFTFLCLFLQRCSADSQDLNGKAFTFTGKTDSIYARLEPSLGYEPLQAISACLRYFTDLPQSGREQIFLSMATGSNNKGFGLGKLGQKRHQVYVGGAMADFWGLPDELNEWNSFCVTWESATGLTQVWLNGKPSSRKTLHQGGTLADLAAVLLGQDQDLVSSDEQPENDGLAGQLTDVHMWNRVITQCEVDKFSKNNDFKRGNMINWHALVFSAIGDVVLEDQITSQHDLQKCKGSDLKDVPVPDISLSDSSDMSGKSFTFGAETSDSYVKLKPSLNETITIASVCLRYFTDNLSKDQSFFSLATRSHSNGFLLCKEGKNQHQMYIGNARADFYGLPEELNAWNSFCATWNSATGLTQVWLNGKPSSRKTLFKGGSLTGTPFIVLGQDQDSYGGGFKSNDALIGGLTDVHMWDRILTPCEIKQFTENKLESGGNVINWKALDYSKHGNVVKDDHGIGLQECK